MAQPDAYQLFMVVTLGEALTLGFQKNPYPVPFATT